MSTLANTQRWPNFSKLVFFARPKKKKNSGFYKTEMRKKKTQQQQSEPKTLPLLRRPPWYPGHTAAREEHRAGLQVSLTGSAWVDPSTSISLSPGCRQRPPRGLALGAGVSEAHTALPQGPLRVGTLSPLGAGWTSEDQPEQRRLLGGRSPNPRRSYKAPNREKTEAVGSVVTTAGLWGQHLSPGSAPSSTALLQDAHYRSLWVGVGG